MAGRVSFLSIYYNAPVLETFTRRKWNEEKRKGVMEMKKWTQKGRGAGLVISVLTKKGVSKF
jgi:hypothetical protein